MQDIVPAIRVECHSALCGDTPILIENEIVSLEKIFMVNKDASDLNSFALNSKGNIVNAKIMEVPQQITIPETVKIQLHYGLGIECSPGTPILTREGFKPAQDLTKDTIVDLLMFNYSSGDFHLEDAEIIDIQKSSIIQVQKKAYLFISEFNNILIPYYKEGADSIGFICIQQ